MDTLSCMGCRWNNGMDCERRPLDENGMYDDAAWAELKKSLKANGKTCHSESNFTKCGYCGVWTATKLWKDGKCPRHE